MLPGAPRGRGARDEGRGGERVGNGDGDGGLGTVGFCSRREVARRSLAEADRSKKGSLDAPIRDLVGLLNASPNAFTTSSCSGRVALFAEPPPRLAGQKKGKGGEWVHVSHERADADAIWEALRAYLDPDKGSASRRRPLTFRFDPFILAAECRSLPDAQALVKVARECGFRETGMIASGGSLGGRAGGASRFLVSIRCSIRLEAPLTDAEGSLVASESYIRFLCASANEKFEANQERYRRLESAFAAGRHLLPGGQEVSGADPSQLRPAFRALAKRQGAVLQRLKRFEEAALGEGDTCSVADSGGARTSAHALGIGQHPGLAALGVAKTSAKVWKDALKDAGWLDCSRQVRVDAPRGRIFFPISAPAVSVLSTALELRSDSPIPEAIPAGVCTALETHRGGAQILVPSPSRGEVRTSRSSPRERLCHSVLRVLQDAAISQTSCLQALGASPGETLEQVLARTLPRRWEKLGDLILLPEGAMKGSPWDELEKGGLLWPAVAGALGCSRLGRQARIADNGRRESRVELLLGDDGWVTHRENGIVYCFDASECMFSSGNVTEKSRVARLPCSGETVVDMYAGIGYYTLPFLVHAGASKVVACEWNPNAVRALRHNLGMNNVEGRCEVREGDCRHECPQGVADRVSLGLLPSSREGWLVALRALRVSGGILHIHENVLEEDGAALQDFARQMEADLEALASSSLGRVWKVRVVHIEKVKWYAPRVRHAVFDVVCCPKEGSSSEGRSHPLSDLAPGTSVQVEG